MLFSWLFKKKPIEMPNRLNDYVDVSIEDEGGNFIGTQRFTPDAFRDMIEVQLRRDGFYKES